MMLMAKFDLPHAFSQITLPGSDKPQYGIFPWQVRLFHCLLSGNIPDALDIPTGLGKTSVMALWLLARATGTGTSLPQRLVYVVDRRTVVDQATEYAEMLRTNLDGDRCKALKEALGLTGSLRISTLRGQHADNREWLEDPAAPAIIIGTVDMVGSRLLFGGYGVSTTMRPMHAGLLALDTLLLLDEAHLSQPFQHMAYSLGGMIGAQGLRMMTLSATQSAGGGAFRLDEEDWKNPTVAQRLKARKRLRIEDRDGAKPKDFTDAALKMAEAYPNARILVFQDRFDAAVDIAKDLAKQVKIKWKREDAVGTLTGQRRGRERDRLVKWLKDAGFVAGEARKCNGPVFLVATSAGEVGVDLDADHMLCDLVAWERMVQRLGRVNRRGEGDAQVQVWDAGNSASVAEEEFERRRVTRRLLEDLPGTDEKQAGPAALAALFERVEIGAASTRSPLYPALQMPLVEAWAMTSLPKDAGRPEVGPWLRGWETEAPPQTVLVWRKYLPVCMSGGQLNADPAEIDRYLDMAPLRSSEMLETEHSGVLNWMKKHGKALAKLRGEGAQLPPLADCAAVVLAQDRTVEKLITFADWEGAGKRDWDRIASFLPGRTLLLRAEVGGLDGNGLLAPKADSATVTGDADAEGFEDMTIAVAELQASEDGLVPKDLPDRLGVFRTLVGAAGQEMAGFAVYRCNRTAMEGEEAKSVRRTPQTIDDHAKQVVARVEDYAARLGLDPSMKQALTLAAECHDAGKRSPVWQRAAGAPLDDKPLAKTDGRGANWPLLNGYRHEFGSLIECERRENIPAKIRDLVLHLVASHHGRARPLIGVEGCVDAPPTQLTTTARDAALRYARLNRELGPWRLAWLEAILRAADQQASREAEGQKDG